MDFDIPRSEKQIRERIRYHFLKNQHIQDVRVIDMLVIKVTSFEQYKMVVNKLEEQKFNFCCSTFQGQMELRETVNRWKTTTAIMLYFNDTHEPKPSSFLGKFMAGQD